MKLYILGNEKTNPQKINIIEVTVLKDNPFVRTNKFCHFELINAIFRAFELPLLEEYQHVKHTLSYEQILALIISACLPVEDMQTSSFLDLNPPFPKNIAWWPLSNSTNNSNKYWMSVNCQLVTEYQARAMTVATKITFLNNYLHMQYTQFVKNCSDIIRLKKPYHPLLPTPEMCYAPETVSYPGHLPLIFTIRGIKCLNWNIRYPTLPVRYIKEDDGSPNNPNKIAAHHANEQLEDKQVTVRKRHIKNSLCILIHKQHVDIITLQNNFLEENDYAELCTQLGDKWQFQLSHDQSKTVIIFSSPIFTMQHVESQIYIMKFCLQDLRINKKWVICNVDFITNEIPFETENEILKLLSSDASNTPIIIGNFNAAIASLDLKRKLITTSVAPLLRNGIQGCDWSHGCFSLSADRKPIQIDGEVCDPSTGDIFAHNNIAEWYDDVTLAQKVEMNRLRPFIDITNQYSKITIDGCPLIEMEAQLINGLDDSNLKVRLSVNAFNQRGFVIMSDKLIHHRQHFSQAMITISNKYNTIKTTTVCCDELEFKRFYTIALQQNTYKLTCRFNTFFSEYQNHRSITEDLLNLSWCFCKYLPERANAVANTRKVQFQLTQFCGSCSELVQLCAKMVLANFYLHFTEYDETDLNKMGHPQIPLFRPDHFQRAMMIYLNSCAKFATTNINIFTPLQRQIIKANLIELGNNLLFVYNAFSLNLKQLINLYEMRNFNKTKPIDQVDLNRIVETTISDIQTAFRKVSACQNILLACDEIKPENILGISSAHSNTTDASNVNIAASRIPPAVTNLNINAESESAEEKGVRMLVPVKLNLQPVLLVKSFFHLAYATLESLKMRRS